jgi:hypothetical protein
MLKVYATITFILMLGTALLTGKFTQSVLEKKHAQALAKQQHQYDVARKAAEDLLKQKYEDAQNVANTQIKEYRKRVDILNVDNVRLRDTTATLRNRIATASPKALADTVAAVTELFGECTIQYTDMAAKAQGHADDVRTLMKFQE